MTKYGIDPGDYIHIFREMLHVSSDGFIVVDRGSIVTDISEKYCEFLGKPRKEIVGYHITKTIPNSKMMDVVEYGYADELALHHYVPGYTKDHEDAFVLVSRSAVRNGKGEIVAGIAQVYFRDQSLKVAKSMIREVQEMELYKELYENMDGQNFSFKDVIGSSAMFQEIKKQGVKAAQNAFPVLITGESGTGKDVFARAIHKASSRAGRPMVAVNCAAIPNDLLETELFGYDEGAFTGAKRGGKPGKFQLADRGTLFLDEIGDMPLLMQAKLLRVLQEKEIDPIGGSRTIPVDVRIIAATNKNLEEMVKREEFREDLYYRLNVITINMPPLRERRDDIEELSRKFLSDLNKEYHKSIVFSEDVIEQFMKYDWPGNIRELYSVIAAAYATSDGLTIDLHDLPGKFYSEHYTSSLAAREKAEAAFGENDSGGRSDLTSDPEQAPAFITEEEFKALPIRERIERIEYYFIKEAYEKKHSMRKAAEYLEIPLATYARKKKHYEEKFG